MTSSDAMKEQLAKRLGILSLQYQSTTEFARICGVNARAIRRAIMNGTGVNATTLMQIAEKTGCNTDWLLLGIGEPFGKEAGEEAHGDTSTPSREGDSVSMDAKAVGLEMKIAALEGQVEYLHKRLMQTQGHTVNPPSASAPSS